MIHRDIIIDRLEDHSWNRAVLFTNKWQIAMYYTNLRPRNPDALYTVLSLTMTCIL